jgi:rod shape-determining protein MreB
MLIGERTAENLKMTIATAAPAAKTETTEVKGRDLVAGIPKVVVATSDEIREALVEPVSQIVETVLLALERTPPELAADIVDRGIMLVGGGSMLRGLDVVLRQETKLPILRSEDPFTAVVHGAGRALENLDLLKRVALQ